MPPDPHAGRVPPKGKPVRDFTIFTGFLTILGFGIACPPLLPIVLILGFLLAPSKR
jgi:hypothetical protein